jgi:hypothetical protein
MRTVQEKLGNLQENATITKSAEAAIKKQLDQTTAERILEEANRAPQTTQTVENVITKMPEEQKGATKFVESSASVPQGVGAEAKEPVPQSKEERFDSELEELDAMAKELSSANESSLAIMLEKIDAKIASLEFSQRSKEESGGVANQIVANIVGRLKVLKSAVEARLKK